MRPHGVRGEVRAAIHTHIAERFTWLEQVHISRDPESTNPESVTLDGVRFHQGHVLLQLRGHDSREAAELLRGYWLMVPEAEAIPLEEDEVYLYELKGLAVYTDEGEHLGLLVEVLETGANEVFVVRGDAGEVLLPNIEEVVLEVDREAQRMLVHLIPGLRP